MECPKISIVTPSFNQAIYLEETIRSVLDQGYPNLEYIIIDGGSTDNSVEIIKKYEKKLTYWISEKDEGMYHAIQKGFDRSTGEIMAWINSDDMYHRNALFTVSEIFSSFLQINWLVGASTAYDEQGRTVLCNHSRMFTKYDFYNHDFKWLQQESVFWRRSLWEKAGRRIEANLKYAGDFELWLRFFKYDKLFVTNALIGGYRFRSSGQLSVVHLEEYFHEVKTALSKVILDKGERNILKNYQNLIFAESLLGRLKIFRTNWILHKYKNRYFPKSALIEFDRNIMRFVLIK